MAPRHARHAAIATGHRLTSEACAEIICAGGTAADAAIGGFFVACLAEPILAQPAGGGFAVVARPGGPVRLLDMFVDAPARAGADRTRGLDEIVVDFGTATQTFWAGGGSVAAPCLIPGLFLLHEEAGRLPMRELVQPAVEAARSGVALNGFQARVLSYFLKAFASQGEMQAFFRLGEDGPLEGRVFRRPDYADMLEVLAREGPRLASEGEIAAAIAETAGDGHLTRDDLKRVRPVWRRPVMRPFIRADRDGGRRLTDLALTPPPAAGGSLIAAILDAYGAPSQRFCRIAFAGAVDRVDRAWKRAGKPADFTLDGEPGRPAPVQTRGTTHISVVTPDQAVAFTISNGEGSCRVAKGCGFITNNMLGEDDLLADGPGSWVPGARLASMMCPSVALDHDGGLMAFGSGGSNRIRTAMANVAARRLIHGESLGAAVEGARVHVEGGRCDAELLAPCETAHREVEELSRRFEDFGLWQEPSMFFGGVHAAEVDASGVVTAAADHRRDGVAITLQGR